MDPQHAASKHECESLVNEIHEAFKNVTREHGVSWNETSAIDDYASDEACAAARLTDKDAHWTQLIEDKDWKPFPGFGGFSFIDAIGFRYYLPLTMIRFLRDNADEWFPGHFADVMAQQIDAKDAMWTNQQLRCIAWFISYMARHDTGFPEPDDTSFESREAWRVLYERGWRKRFEGPHPPYPRTP